MQARSNPFRRECRRRCRRRTLRNGRSRREQDRRSDTEVPAPRLAEPPECRETRKRPSTPSSSLSLGDVAVILEPEDLAHIQLINVVYLHRSANAELRLADALLLIRSLFLFKAVPEVINPVMGPFQLCCIKRYIRTIEATNICMMNLLLVIYPSISRVQTRGVGRQTSDIIVSWNYSLRIVFPDNCIDLRAREY